MNKADINGGNTKSYHSTIKVKWTNGLTYWTQY